MPRFFMVEDREEVALVHLLLAGATFVIVIPLVCGLSALPLAADAIQLALAAGSLES